MVKAIDNKSYIHVNNRRRLERFLDKNSNKMCVNEKSKPLYNFDIIGLTTERNKLYDIIDSRVDKMVVDGLLNEVKKFYESGDRSKAIMTAIGYKELYEYFDSKIDLEEALDNIKRNSRRFAKRQYTFFNNQFEMKWFTVNYDNPDNTLNDILDYIRR